MFQEMTEQEQKILKPELEKLRKGLMEKCGYSESDNLDLEVIRTSTWVIKVSLVKGLCIWASFKMNIRTGDVKRLL